MGESAVKKSIMLFSGVLLLLSGCSLVEEEKPAVVVSEIVHTTKVASLSDRDFQQEVTLVDTRDQSVVQKLDPKYYENPKEHVEELEQLVRELAADIDQPMLPAKIDKDGKLLPGQSRVILDEEKLLNQLLAITVFDKNIELPIEVTEPNVTEESIKDIDKVVEGSFTTRFNPSVKNRNTNIEISAKEIDKVVLGPGDRFYFNTIVGDSTPDKGYKKATVIVNKQFVEGWGGGVCQTSSTLFNAVDDAGLDIIELHHHSKSVGYVPEGRDATIAYGFKDFKFVNDKDYPVAVNTYYNESQGILEVKITSAGKNLVASN